MNKLYIDVDSTIIDSISIALRCIEATQGKPYYTYDASKVLTWDMHDVIIRDPNDPLSDNEFMNRIFDCNMFWDWADDYIYAGVKEFVDKYKDRIVFCSIGSILNISKKIEWLRKHFGNVDIIPIITDMSIHPKRIDKSYVKMGNGDILIEDSYANIVMCQAEYNILFNSFGNWTAEWSHDWDADKTQQYYDYTDRAINWDEVSKIVEWIDKDRFISSY